MSTNKVIIEDIFRAFSRGDLQYIVSTCAEDVTWSYYGFPGLPILGDFQGKNGVKDFFESLRFTIKALNHICNKFIVDGDSIVVLGSASVLVKTTGKIFDHNWCHIYTLKEGKIATFRGFTSNPYGMASAFGEVT
jgi:ketosteroid isomerase-like protein